MVVQRPTERTVDDKSEGDAAKGESQTRVLKARASYTFVPFPAVGAGLMQLPRSSSECQFTRCIWTVVRYWWTSGQLQGCHGVASISLERLQPGVQVAVARRRAGWW